MGFVPDEPNAGGGFVPDEEATAPGTIPGSYAARAYSQKQPQHDPTEGMSRTEKFLAGAGMELHNLGVGLTQRAGDVYKLATGKEAEWAPTGREVSEERELQKPLTKSGWAQAGAFTAALPVSRLIPGIKGAPIKSGAIGGAGFGLLTPTGEGESVTENVLEGGALGALLPAALRGATKVVAPAAQKRLQQALGGATLGQALGGAFKTLEEKATSLPIAGHFIQQAHQRVLEGFNQGVINKVLEPIGQKISKIGHEGVQEASKKLSNAYNQILPKLKIQTDETFASEMNNLREMATHLDESTRKQFEKILGPEGLGRKITGAGKMSGESMKEIDRELGRLSRGYGKSEDFDKQQLGRALQEAQASLRSLVERSNPEYADYLSKINQGWARLMRVENAANRAGTKGGVFTPAQLLAASKATDQSLRHKQFAHGSALFQDIAANAEKVIGSKYPDPGTAGRVLLGMGAGAGYLAHPFAALGEAGLAGAYGVPGIQRGLTALAAKRPEWAGKLAEAMRAGAPAVSKGGVAATPEVLQAMREQPEEQPEEQ